MNLDDFSSYAREYLERNLRGREAEIALGEELLALVASDNATLDEAMFRRFWLRRVALFGDSHRAANVGFSGDMISGPMYVRIILRQPFERPTCVHYTVCAVGIVTGVLLEHRMIVLTVEPDDYILGETF